MSPSGDRSLHELGDGLFAYLQRDPGWGWSNAGLVTAGGTSLLVDTLYDLALTRQMLDAMAPVTAANPIHAALNTHANPDHCFGNELLPTAAEIYASNATAREISEVSPELLHMLKTADLDPELRDFVDHAFGAFDFEGISVRPPTQTFDGRLDLRVGDREVSLVELGPAHTGGDTIVHVADADVVFTGDLLFADATPILWTGPFSNWIEACDRIIDLDARVLVPGHGPLSDASAQRDLQRYLRYVHAEARERFDAGMDVQDAADDIDLRDFADWGEPERIAANVACAYREFDPSLPPVSPAENLMAMARWRARH